MTKVPLAAAQVLLNPAVRANSAANLTNVSQAAPSHSGKSWADCQPPVLLRCAPWVSAARRRAISALSSPLSHCASGTWMPANGLGTAGGW